MARGTRVALIQVVAATAPLWALACADPSGGENVDNDLFSVSEGDVSFDSRDDVEIVRLEVEGRADGVTLSTTTITSDGFTRVTEEPGLSRIDERRASLTITRRPADELEPGVHEGRIRVRGCLGERCEDAFVAVSYRIVHLLVDQEQVTFEQRAGGGLDDDTVELQLSHSDGSDSAWTSSHHYGLSDEEGWLTVTSEGQSFDEPVTLTAMPPSTPGQYTAFVTFESDGGSTTIQVHMRVVRGLVANTDQVTFEASIGETPGAQVVTLSDPSGESYRFEVYFMPIDSCAIHFWLDYLPRGGAELPAEITLEPMAMPEAEHCTGTLDVVIDDVTSQQIPISYEISAAD